MRFIVFIYMHVNFKVIGDDARLILVVAPIIYHIIIMHQPTFDDDTSAGAYESPYMRLIFSGINGSACIKGIIEARHREWPGIGYFIARITTNASRQVQWVVASEHAKRTKFTNNLMSSIALQPPHTNNDQRGGGK